MNFHYNYKSIIITIIAIVLILLIFFITNYRYKKVPILNHTKTLDLDFKSINQDDE